MKTLYLCWESTSGCDWLPEVFSIENNNNIKLSIKCYIEKTKETAERYLDDWHRNEEEVGLYPVGIIKDEKGKQIMELNSFIEKEIESHLV